MISINIRQKLLIAFLLLAFLIGGGFGLLYRQYVSNTTQLNTLSQNVKTLQILTLESEVTEQDWISEESINPEFFKTGQSRYIRQHKTITDSVQNLLQLMITDNKHDADADEQFRTMLVHLKHLSDSRHHNFLWLVNKIKERGFKDFGLEGRMRASVHALENSQYHINQVRLLMMRRHEKDYLLRRDKKYIDKLNEEYQELIIENQQNKTVLALLEYYHNSFMTLVNTDEVIGVHNKVGLRGQANNNARQIQAELSKIRQYADKRTTILQEQFQTGFWILLSVLLVCTIAGSFYTAYLFTRPILKLSQRMRQAVETSFTEDIKAVRNTSNDEIGQLTRNFNDMVSNIRHYMNQAETQAAEIALARQDEAIRHQHLQGLEQVSRAMLHQDKNPMAEVIAVLCKKTQAHLAAIYTIEKKPEPTLTVQGTYAIEPKQATMPLDGMYGQVLQDREPIILTNLPKGFYSISSGLGETSPAAVLIVPIQNEYKSIGVLEIAYMKMPDQYTIDFLREACARITFSFHDKNKKNKGGKSPEFA